MSEQMKYYVIIFSKQKSSKLTSGSKSMYIDLLPLVNLLDFCLEKIIT